jgi:hypothetical protein
MFIHTTCVHKFIHTTNPSKQVHKSTNCLKSNETSSEHDQLSPRAYGECSCGGKGGTGDWRTCSPLGACWFEPAEKGCTKETRLQMLDMIRQKTRNSLVSYSPEYRGLAVSETPVGGGVIGARSPGGRCRAYSPGTHARKDEDGLLLEFPCNPTRTCSMESY